MAARQMKNDTQRLSVHEHQLSKAVLEAFETRGWHWTDDELLQQIHAIFTTPQASTLRPRKLQEKLVRKFAESQVVPQPGALLPLCRRFRAELVGAVFDCTKPYDNVRAIFIDSLFDTELQGIVESSDLFPVPYAPREKPWFRAIIGLAKKLELVDETIHASTELNTVLWVVGHAAKRVLEECRRRAFNKVMINYHGADFINQRVQDELAERAKKPDQAQLRRNLARLPAEIRLIIFSTSAIDTTRRWNVISNSSHATHCVDAILMGLCDVESVPKYTMNRSGDIHRDAERSVGFVDVEALFRHEVEEAMIKAVHIDNAIRLPIRGTPSTLPLPRILANQTDRIRHLNLTVKMLLPYPGALYYPSSLYSAQDQLVKLKPTLPTLKTLELTILNRLQGGNSVSLIPKSRQGDLVTKYTEIEELVKRMLEVDIVEKWIRYTTNSHIANYDDRIEARSDGEMASIGKFVGTMISCEGAALEVKAVGEGVGSILEGVEARRAAREWSWA